MSGVEFLPRLNLPASADPAYGFARFPTVSSASLPEEQRGLGGPHYSFRWTPESLRRRAQSDDADASILEDSFGSGSIEPDAFTASASGSSGGGDTTPQAPSLHSTGASMGSPFRPAELQIGAPVERPHTQPTRAVPSLRGLQLPLTLGLPSQAHPFASSNDDEGHAMSRQEGDTLFQDAIPRRPSGSRPTRTRPQIHLSTSPINWMTSAGAPPAFSSGPQTVHAPGDRQERSLSPAALAFGPGAGYFLSRGALVSNGARQLHEPRTMFWEDQSAPPESDEAARPTDSDYGSIRGGRAATLPGSDEGSSGGFSMPGHTRYVTGARGEWGASAAPSSQHHGSSERQYRFGGDDARDTGGETAARRTTLEDNIEAFLFGGPNPRGHQQETTFSEDYSAMSDAVQRSIERRNNRELLPPQEQWLFDHLSADGDLSFARTATSDSDEEDSGIPGHEGTPLVIRSLLEMDDPLSEEEEAALNRAIEESLEQYNDDEARRRRDIARAARLRSTGCMAISDNTLAREALVEENYYEIGSIESFFQRAKDSKVNEFEPDTGEDDRCVICLEAFQHNECISKLRNCEHRFHACCIEPWLVKDWRCPVCRTPIYDEVEE
uniref:RING-type E3 ubiquitin transferase n=1 Tax=Phaeomonas parva TaxID=124430 RepID=A0A7S1UJI2_9STRA|mmetsp:Transcript_8231/g.23449  ORF Transcript_8231/g.23449 Transcript_8231/m.23449 type:complete len:609 (+) Transcript_8231:279-2105(+)